jgi:hypothetical protein
VTSELGPDAVPDADDLAIARALDVLPTGAQADTVDPDLLADYLDVVTNLPFDEIAPPPPLENRVIDSALAARPATVSTIEGARERRRRFDRASTETVRSTEPTPLRRRFAIVAAAAAVAALLALGSALLANRNDSPGAAPVSTVDHAQRVKLHRLEADPSASRSVLRSASGTSVGRVIVGSDGDAFIYDVSLPRAPAGHTYWLWLDTGSGVTRVGDLGPALVAAELHVRGPVHGVIISSEPIGTTPASPRRPLVASSAR